jgi:hypothetical protein
VKNILLFLIFTNFGSFAQFKFIDTGEMAIYNEQIWKIEELTVSIERNKQRDELYQKSLSWAKSLVLEDNKWNIVTENNKSILCKGYFEFLYNKHGSVSSYPALISFELQIEDGKVIFRLNELKTRYEGEAYNTRYPYDVKELSYSILTFRPYKRVGKKIKKAKDYEQMKRVEYYLNNYVEALSKFIG